MKDITKEDFSITNNIDFFIDKDHEYCDANNMLYRHLMQLNLNEEHFSTYCYSAYNIDNNKIIIAIFNAAYNVIHFINADSNPQTKLDKYFIISKQIIKVLLNIDSNEDAIICVLACHAMAIVYCVLDLPYETSDNYPDLLSTFFYVDLHGRRGNTGSFNSILRYYVSTAREDSKWKKLKQKYINSKRDEEARKFAYGQKIIVELLKQTFHKYNVSFKTKKNEAAFISIITGWSDDKIAGLLSSPTTIIPGKYKMDIEKLNSILKNEFGLDIVLETK